MIKYKCRRCYDTGIEFIALGPDDYTKEICEYCDAWEIKQKEKEYEPEDRIETIY